MPVDGVAESMNTSLMQWGICFPTDYGLDLKPNSVILIKRYINVLLYRSESYGSLEITIAVQRKCRKWHLLSSTWISTQFAPNFSLPSQLNAVVDGMR